MTYRLEPDRERLVDCFNRDHAPVLRCDPGDRVIVHTLDSAGYLAPMRSPDDAPPVALPYRRGHCLVGPIAVRGARPGALLAVHSASGTPTDWGCTVSGGRDTPINRRLGLADGEPGRLLWRVDHERGRATTQHG